MIETPPVVSIAKTFFALGAAVVRAELLKEIATIPDCRNKSPRELKRKLEELDNNNIIHAAHLVMSAAQRNNHIASGIARMQINLGDDSEKTQLKLTSLGIEAGLLRKAQVYLLLGERDRRLMAHQLRLGVNL